MRRYNPKEIEPKWQAEWEKSKIYEATEDTSKPKKYILEYFPYPSGAAMHVGHVRNYTIGDVIARFTRMRGYNVLHPMGWDAFGLPAENYAIKNKISPQKAIAQNTTHFKQQLMQMGFSYDWSREINSSDPDYYKWTQWFFLLLYKKGLAYQKEALVNWDPVDKTVLANEQVIDGRADRSGAVVEKKALKQWFFKITAYADRLLDDVEDLNWSEAIKSMQRNWIGRSTGAEVEFKVASDNNYVLLHGYTASAKSDFLPWLKEQLEKDGAQVNTPDLPNSNQPDANKQAEYVLQNSTLNENTILLGHSYGSVTALRVVEQLKTPIKKLVLVAAFAQPGFLDNERNFEKTTDWNFDFEKIKKNVKDIVVLRATNDSAVPKERADFLSEKLDARIVDFEAAADHVTGAEEPAVLRNVVDTIKVFTTRPDTLFGATFMVLAPEHPLVIKITDESHKKEVEQYIKKAGSKSDIERQETDREKTGVFTGAYVINPVNKEKIPVWIADYVLYGYGTGAIMAVPAHDQRDYEFAKVHKLPVKQVIASYEVYSGVNAPKANLETIQRKSVDAIIVGPDGRYLLQIEGDQVHFVGGGVDPDDFDYEAALKREVLEETGFKNIKAIRQVAPAVGGIQFRHTKGKNQQGIGAFYEVILDNLDKIHSEADDGKHKLEWVDKTDIEKRLTWSWHIDGWRHYLNNKDPYTYFGEGILVDSGKYDFISSSEAREKIVSDLAKSGQGQERVNYKIRDWLISRQRYWGAPIPIIHCPKDGIVPVPEDQLPVTLPELKTFEPSGDGRSPLARVPEFVNTTCPTCGGPAERETDTMDGFACSSWYFLRFADPHNSQAAFDRKKADFWLPVDDYIGGAEHAVMHLLYARFWTKVMHDEGLIDFDEPFTTLRNQGMILAPDGQKMSKSKGNTIDPDGLIEQGYGADSTRIMELFIGPWNQSANWSVEGMGGSFRFLQRVWTLVQEYKANDEKGQKADVLPVTHQAIAKVSQDLEDLGFNTAIASLMEFVNDLYKIKAEKGYGDEDWAFALTALVQLLAPFAPHISEELWQELGHKGSVHVSEWPVHDPKYLVKDSLTIVVQVNGKVRANIEVSADSSEEAITKQAQNNERVQSYLKDKALVKTIYIPGKLVSFVVK